MTPTEIKELITILKDSGVTHYKTPELELNIVPAVAKNATAPATPPVEETNEIKHKVEEMTSLMGLDDIALLNRMIPDHTDYGDDEEPINATG